MEKVVLLIILFFPFSNMGQTSKNQRVLKHVNGRDTTIIEIPLIASDSGRFIGKWPEPRFPGNLDSFITHHLSYPLEAKKMKIEGSVDVVCEIDEQGKVVRKTVVSNSHQLLDKEALRIIEKMPDWIPAMLDGKPVPSVINVKIKFDLATQN